MLEIFFAICAFTSLECHDITVTYYDLEEGTLAGASYDLEGNYYILINEDEVEGKNEKFWQRLMVHEIAHLLVFELDPLNTSHYGIYKELCDDLRLRTGTMGRHTCKPYAEPPPYPWTARRE